MLRAVAQRGLRVRNASCLQRAVGGMAVRRSTTAAPVAKKGLLGRAMQYTREHKRELLWKVPVYGGVAYTAIGLAVGSYVLGLTPLQVLEQDVRSARSAWVMAMITMDYKWTLRNEPDFRQMRDALGVSAGDLELAKSLRQGADEEDGNVERTIASAEAESIISGNAHLSAANAVLAGRGANVQPQTVEEYLTLKDQWKEVRDAIHQRSAERLLWLCRKNGGIFTKAGQHIASLNNILPKQYISTLSVLQDHAPYVPYKEVVQVFQEELNMHPNDIFSHFEEVPIAAASLAQVHRATLRATGETVAVKVQYPKLSKLVNGDLGTIAFLVKVIGWSFPAFEFSWLMPEFRANMDMELDFKQEAAHACRTSRLFQHNDQLYVPAVHDEYTSKRVMTMEFVEGVKVNNIEGLTALGVAKKEVARVVCELFSEQIHIHGFIHCDPHPGNLLVRKIAEGKDKGKPQIVLLDHGLYRELTEDFRKNYCHLWKALVLRNQQEILEYSTKLGAGQFADLFSVMLTLRPPSSKKALNSKFSKNDVNELKEIVIGSHEKLSQMLKELDRDLLMVLRTTHLVRALNMELGGGVNRFNIMARHSIDGIYHSAVRESAKAAIDDSMPIIEANVSMGQKLGRWRERLLFEINLMLIPAVMSLFGFFTGRKLQSPDDLDVIEYNF